jgi:hypothetical protein
MAKKFDPKAKAKREKVVAAVAGVVLLGVLAISVPMTMKMMKSQDATSSSTTSTTAAAATPAAPAASPSTPVVATADLVSATVAPAPGLGQLGSLDRFESKDPFSQQIRPGGVTAGSGVPAAREGSGGRPAAGGSAPSGLPAPSGPSGPTAPTAGPPPTSAVISVNGGPAQQISLDQDFPLPPFDPIFHLVSLTRSSAKVAIVGGSYASGASTATVRKGRPLTLMNTADGTRYVLRLLWVGAGAPPDGLVTPPAQPNSPTATTPGASTPPTAPTATTAATP